VKVLEHLMLESKNNVKGIKVVIFRLTGYLCATNDTKKGEFVPCIASHSWRFYESL